MEQTRIETGAITLKCGETETLELDSILDNMNMQW